MTRQFIIILIASFMIPGLSPGQRGFIFTKEGRPILGRKGLITNCLESLHKDRSDKTALSICECQVDKIDGHFTNKEYKKHSARGIINIGDMVKEDSVFENEIQDCYTNSGKTILLQAEGFESEFMSQCIKSIQKSSEKNIDINRLTNFCSCELDMVKTRKLSDAEMANTGNPNSPLFYEMIQKCGDPFSDAESSVRNWNPNFEKDINGPVNDTLRTLTINGMTYIRVKIGSMEQIWLFDTGASELLITREMEIKLKEENIMSEKDYLGTAEYEMANGMIDTCRKYRINNIQIGKFTINNINVAVTDKGKRIIAGKGLLNKFSYWQLDNRNNALILNK